MKDAKQNRHLNLSRPEEQLSSDGRWRGLHGGSSLVSAAVVNTMTKTNMGRKG